MHSFPVLYGEQGRVSKQDVFSTSELHSQAVVLLKQEISHANLNLRRGVLNKFNAT